MHASNIRMRKMIHPLRTTFNLLLLNTQFLPRSKHSPSLRYENESFHIV